MKKVLLSLGAVAFVLVALPMFSAFEAHVINVVAKIENALSVDTRPINFGTVFPQEELERPLAVQLSQSFVDEENADDVRYIIRQKPKCGVTTDNGTVLVGPTWTGHVVPTLDDPQTTDVDESKGGTAYTIDCEKDKPANLEEATYGLLPMLCQYISKHPVAACADGLDNDNDQAIDGQDVDCAGATDDNEGLPGSQPEGDDGSLNSFHQPFSVSNSTVQWNDVHGLLAKSLSDRADLWTIDLAVPCFGGYCAQDWADFVHGINPDADPNAYTQSIDNEHKIFGCNLWIEVTEVSRVDTNPTDNQ
ncbi:MAG: hypothetical protein AAB581_00620 [Patescibacteria group bacterium]